MGTFTVPMEIGHPDGGDKIGVSALVDTGSVHTMLPQSLLNQIRIQPQLQKSFRFADDKEHLLGVGFCLITWQEEQAICPVIFGPEEKYLMGATTLEIFDLAIEPSRQTLTPRIHHERSYF